MNLIDDNLVGKVKPEVEISNGGHHLLWMELPWQISHVEALVPSCDSVLRWGLWEVIWFRWGHEAEAHQDGINATRTLSLAPHPPQSLPPLTTWAPYEDTERRQLSMNKDGNPRQKSNGWNLYLGLSQTSGPWEINLNLFKPSSLCYFLRAGWAD